MQSPIFCCVDVPPYRTGFLGLREIPVFLSLAKQIPDSIKPDVIMVDGGGRFHPRRFGSACDLGYRLGIPTIGVSKSLLYNVLENNPTEQAIQEQVNLSNDKLLYLNDADNGEPLVCAIAGSITCLCVCWA